MKLTANELRIGNLISANGLHWGKVMPVDYIGQSHEHNQGERVLFFVGSEAGEFIKDCSGIPLTEDLLLRSGFEYDSGYQSTQMGSGGWKVFHRNMFNSGYYGIIGDFSICFEDRKFYHFNDVFGDREYSSLGIEVKYYHELQNLVYALTKTELELKPE